MQSTRSAGASYIGTGPDVPADDYDIWPGPDSFRVSSAQHDRAARDATTANAPLRGCCNLVWSCAGAAQACLILFITSASSLRASLDLLIRLDGLRCQRQRCTPARSSLETLRHRRHRRHKVQPVLNDAVAHAQHHGGRMCPGRTFLASLISSFATRSCLTRLNFLGSCRRTAGRQLGLGQLNSKIGWRQHIGPSARRSAFACSTRCEETTSVPWAAVWSR